MGDTFFFFGAVHGNRSRAGIRLSTSAGVETTFEEIKT